MWSTCKQTESNAFFSGTFFPHISSQQAAAGRISSIVPVISWRPAGKIGTCFFLGAWILVRRSPEWDKPCSAWEFESFVWSICNWTLEVGAAALALPEQTDRFSLASIVPTVAMAIRRSDGLWEGNKLTQMTFDPVTFCQRKSKCSSTKSHLEFAGTYLMSYFSCRGNGQTNIRWGAQKISEDLSRSILSLSASFLGIFWPYLFDIAVAFMPQAVWLSDDQFLGKCLRIFWYILSIRKI